MPSPRALVRLRVEAEQRLSEDITVLSEVLGMAPEEVPQLLVPRVPNNDPGLKHVRFLEGVATIMERFLEHAGVDMAARRAQPEDATVAEHQRPELNMSGGPNAAPGVGDPRMVNIGQGLAEPQQPSGVHPGMLEGDIEEVKDAISELDVNNLAILEDLERRRVGGARSAVLEALADREADLKKEAAEAGAPDAETQKVIAERQAEAEAAAEAERQAAESTQPQNQPAQSPTMVGMSPQRQLAPERPPAAQRQRKGARGRSGR